MNKKVISDQKEMSDSLKAAQQAGAYEGMKSVGHGEYINGNKFIGIKKGCAGEPFSHFNEQITIVVEGCIEFHLEDEVHILRAGDTVFVPANKVHYGIALEDSTVIDMFAPPRKFMD